jgi:heat shock protein beta
VCLIADDVVKREEEAIKLDGLNMAQIKLLRDKAEKVTFQAEVNRMMKLIINSLYHNKEMSLQEALVFLVICISCDHI